MLEAKIREYRELKRMAEEAQAMADAIADEIKAAMNEAGESKMVVGEYKLSYTEAKRETLDKKTLARGFGRFVRVHQNHALQSFQSGIRKALAKAGNFGKGPAGTM